MRKERQLRRKTWVCRTDPDAFSFTRQIYEEQRQAFLTEQLKRKKVNMQLPAVVHVFSSPERRQHKRNEELLVSPPFSIKPTYKSFDNANKGQLIMNMKRGGPSKEPPSYAQEIDDLMAKCKETEQLPSLNRRLSREKSLLKEYSARMDWTLDMLVKHADIEYRVLSPLFQYFAEDKVEIDAIARHAAKAMRHSRAVGFNSRLRPKKKGNILE